MVLIFSEAVGQHGGGGLVGSATQSARRGVRTARKGALRPGAVWKQLAAWGSNGGGGAQTRECAGGAVDDGDTVENGRLRQLLPHLGVGLFDRRGQRPHGHVGRSPARVHGKTRGAAFTAPEFGDEPTGAVLGGRN